MGNGVNGFGHVYLSILCKTGLTQGSVVKNVPHLKSTVRSRRGVFKIMTEVIIYQ